MDLRPFALIALLLAAGAAPAQAPAVQPYLTDRAPDTARILPPAPTSGSPRGVADRAIFKATRALQGSPRWSLAQNDADERAPAMLADFSCATGARLTETDAPRLVALLHRMRLDVVTAVNKPKDLYRRQRPFLIDKGDICVARTPALALSPDYPSGHSTWGWTVGLVLAEAAPDRAAEILNRARAFGESRVVCGVHNASAIEAARTNAAALFSVLNADPAFRADLDAVRAELAAARAAGPAPDAGACQAEAALTTKSPW
ncbi:MAG: phosphatase PAP2 family protein [Proteobacteria bacterium]|nr:phosphatase PAP2 family protein [Pseudomonadota bacterium]